MVGQQAAGARVVADAEHVEFGVVQLREVGHIYQASHLGHQRFGLVALLVEV